MRYRRLGVTDLEVSEIAFGTGDNAGLMTIAPDADRLKTFEYALSIGINYFDTSPDYGKGRAEENLGRALKLFGKDARRPLYVSTKVEIMPGDVTTSPAGSSRPPRRVCVASASTAST